MLGLLCEQFFRHKTCEITELKTEQLCRSKKNRSQQFITSLPTYDGRHGSVTDIQKISAAYDMHFNYEVIDQNVPIMSVQWAI